MKIRGMSYQKGIFFIGEKSVACAYEQEGQIAEWIRPLNVSTALTMVKQIFFSMPFWFRFFTYLLFAAIFLPKLPFIEIGWNGLPYYFLAYYGFGTHFLFPKELRKYHGAEHKVFSDNGIKKSSRLYVIKKAKITNRYCSTNLVVIYFSVAALLSCLFFLFMSFSSAVMWASYISLLCVPLVNWLMGIPNMKWIRKYVLTVSYWLQEKWTTAEPERKHLLTAIKSYAKLAEHEFPGHFGKQKEEKRVAIVDITVIPVGTKTTSISEYVAAIHTVLQSYKDKISYQLTPMSTLIEGELKDLFEVIQAIHEVPFQAGVERVVTNIRIDDRRDKKVKMEDKVNSVMGKLTQQKEMS